MDKKTAAAIRAWIKNNRKSLGRDADPWAKGYKVALEEFEQVIRLAVAGELDKLREATP